MSPEKLIKEAETFLLNLFSLFRTRQLYSPSHPTFIESLKPVMENLETILYTYAEATFIIVEREFVFDGEPLLRSLPKIREFCDTFSLFHIERFSFFPEVTPEEVIGLITLLSSRPDQIQKDVGLDKIHETYGLTHILLERLPKTMEDGALVSEYTSTARGTTGEGGYGFGILAPSIRKQYRTLYDNTNTILKELSKGEGGDLTILAGQVDHAVDDLMDPIDDFVETFNEKRTPFGDLDHDINACLLMIAFAKMLGLEPPLIKDLALASLLHDIGKIFLPAELQHKPENLLTPREKEPYRKHPLRGTEYLLTLQNITPLAFILCYEHHIGFNRKGFPHVPDTYTLHPASHMFHIVNLYEKHVRLSPVSKKVGKYLDEIRPNRGQGCDPYFFDLFACLMRKE